VNELQAVDYSADSHPVRFAATRTPDAGYLTTSGMGIWLWDGNDVLAQCTYDTTTATQCSSYAFSVEGLASYNPSISYFAVQDRDLSGQAVANHNAMSFSGMTPVGRPSRTLWASGISASAAPGSTLDGAVGADRTLSGTKLALDGWTLDNNTWQGVRTYDASVGQWNTPDAYAGDVHDPMSQKPYMWNRNNPYSYSDPTGFDAIWTVWRRVWGPNATWYERLAQQVGDSNHVYTVIFHDDGSVEHFSFGPKKDSKGVERLVWEPEDYEKGTVWVASKLEAKCEGLCTRTNGGFDERAMLSVFEYFAMANLPYGHQDAPNSATPQWMACRAAGGDCTSPDGAGVPYGYRDWAPPKPKNGTR
jgi:hypothetical protein